jgi:hypothetical protein
MDEERNELESAFAAYWETLPPQPKEMDIVIGGLMKTVMRQAFLEGATFAFNRMSSIMNGLGTQLEQ